MEEQAWDSVRSLLGAYVRVSEMKDAKDAKDAAEKQMLKEEFGPKTASVLRELCAEILQFAEEYPEILKPAIGDVRSDSRGNSEHYFLFGPEITGYAVSFLYQEGRVSARTTRKDGNNTVFLSEERNGVKDATRDWVRGMVFSSMDKALEISLGLRYYKSLASSESDID